jgi:hypothetical protein
MNPHYSDYRPLFTTQDVYPIVKYVMEVLWPFWYGALWMLRTHTVTPHHVITLYNDILNYIDGVMRALPQKKTQWKQDLYFAMSYAWLKLSKYYTEVSSMKSTQLVSVHILDPFGKLQSLRKWDNGIDINPNNDTSYITQYLEGMLKYEDNICCSKHRRLPVFDL